MARMSEREFPDMWVDPQDDPREGGPSLGDERATLVEYLRCQRLTLTMKCDGLDADQLARRSVEPSPLSLLGLVRHMAEVERGWSRRTMAWRVWRDECAVTEQLVADADDLGVTDPGQRISLREVLVHLVEEYARHNGHADFLRERIDGRVGE